MTGEDFPQLPAQPAHSEFRRAWAEIDLGALSHNISVLAERYAGGSRLMAVVKADAYGHGVSLIAPECVRSGIRNFGVATVDEGIALRAFVPADSGVYILAPTLPQDSPDLVAHRLVPLIGDLAQARALADSAAAAAQTAEAHVEIDTGMGRSGIAVAHADELFAQLRGLRDLRITGLATHFARADEDAIDAGEQYDLFSDMLAGLGNAAEGLLIHIHNSPAALVLPNSLRHGLIRCGLLLYGIEPSPGMFAQARIDLRPVLSLRARVALSRSLAEGATISYGKTYTAPTGGGIYATVAAGYGDGFPRSLSNKGRAAIRGRYAPICGRVCMDQFVVDVTGIPGVEAGDIATLIGIDGDCALRAADIAALVAATPHEITTCLSSRVPRVAVGC